MHGWMIRGLGNIPIIKEVGYVRLSEKTAVSRKDR